MKKIIVLLALLCMPVSHAAAAEMDLSKGFDGYAWGDKCSRLFTGKGWVEERSKVVWEPNTKDIQIVYGDETGEFVLHRNFNEKPGRESKGVLNTYYGCKKTDGSFKFVLMRISLLKYKELKNYLYLNLGDHTKKFGPVRTWDKGDIYVQLNQTMLLVYHK